MKPKAIVKYAVGTQSNGCKAFALVITGLGLRVPDAFFHTAELGVAALLIYVLVRSL